MSKKLRIFILILIASLILSFLPLGRANISYAGFVKKETRCCIINGPCAVCYANNKYCNDAICLHWCGRNKAWALCAGKWYLLCIWKRCCSYSPSYWSLGLVSQDCGTSSWSDNYSCSAGRILQRLWINRWCGSNGYSQCYNSSEWRNYTDCCSGTECYYCDGWGSPYCKGDDVYHQRTCYNKGCKDNACYSTSGQQEEKAEECGENGYVDEYQCAGDWSQKKYITRGCNNGSCTESFEWKNVQNCAATCYTDEGRLSDNCEYATLGCNPATGQCGAPYQSCQPPQYVSSETPCLCDGEKGTVKKVCNGAGGCVNTEEKCDTRCGAVPACQGLKPGDLNPENPALKCCKGIEWLPKWREIAP